MLLLCRYPGSWIGPATIGPATDAELSRRDIGAPVLEVCQREPLVRAGVPARATSTQLKALPGPKPTLNAFSAHSGLAVSVMRIRHRQVKRIAAKAAPVLASPSRGKELSWRAKKVGTISPASRTA